eukprot:5063247-Pyramimonas_sp.AAC.3
MASDTRVLCAHPPLPPVAPGRRRVCAGAGTVAVRRAPLDREPKEHTRGNGQLGTETNRVVQRPLANQRLVQSIQKKTHEAQTTGTDTDMANSAWVCGCVGGSLAGSEARHQVRPGHAP